MSAGQRVELLGTVQRDGRNTAIARELDKGHVSFSPFFGGRDSARKAEPAGRDDVAHDFG